jgi:hypothetical protein
VSGLPLRQWRVSVDVLIGEHIDDDDIDTRVAIVEAETAQSALRQLVLTTTENARVTRIEVTRV